ncbi:hypothetical protein AVEN_127715-1 [Araneus ventricosus]|uniref:Uncharacterized protein n=1 Tax=Araneus ventricosus TaxID=182803 RepID=A0A4Y2R9P5_ARAVE|nr:hypothetical protein AVEN_87080-1 [Araneus ventricosus]GBN72402.1 hypothetical protein AVEN_149269-1 [Araneus ventricosus]GBN78854.1 hypothetical protein AVEN_121291-1 [Araneus ventricosus]GBN78859.1 hypothetical protein AVEN_127715-1 [Araneus ventricosus]
MTELKKIFYTEMNPIQRNLTKEVSVVEISQLFSDHISSFVSDHSTSSGEYWKEEIFVLKTIRAIVVSVVGFCGSRAMLRKAYDRKVNHVKMSSIWLRGKVSISIPEDSRFDAGLHQLLVMVWVWSKLSLMWRVKRHPADWRRKLERGCQTGVVFVI